MQKIVTAFVALVCLLGAGAWALWVLPPADPLDYIQFSLNHGADRTVGVTTAEAAEICPSDMAFYRAGCVDHLTHPHFAAWESHARFLAEVQAIPDDDCVRMTEVLMTRNHLANDTTLVKNARGGFNCDFTRRGIAHIDWPEKADGYDCAPFTGVTMAMPKMSAADFEVCVRRTYVTRPVYNLSRTRFSIEDGGLQGGEKCVYTRLRRWRITEQWQLERCDKTWAA